MQEYSQKFVHRDIYLIAVRRVLRMNEKTIIFGELAPSALESDRGSDELMRRGRANLGHR